MPHRATKFLRGVGVIILGLAVAGGHAHRQPRAGRSHVHTAAAQPKTAPVGLYAAVGAGLPVGRSIQEHDPTNGPAAVERGGRAGLYRQTGIGPHGQQGKIVLA